MHIQSDKLPVVHCEIEPPHVGLDVVLKTFLLPTGASPIITELGLKDLFGETCVGRADDMSSPPKSVLHQYSGDAVHGFLQNADVGPSVLPVDPEDAA